MMSNQPIGRDSLAKPLRRIQRDLSDGRSQRGGSLIEVLVTMVILMVGLLGLVGLMVQAQRGQVESYQRIQALVVLQDMVNRINTNRKAAACYVTATYVGTGGTLPAACGAGTAEQIATVARDMAEWQQLLLGSAETAGGGGAVGTMIGARGCVTTIVAGSIYRVTVAWQGTSATIAPPASSAAVANVACASGEFGTETFRRAVYQDVRIINLSS